MYVTAKKLTDVSLLQRACGFTTGKPSLASLSGMYSCEHSPIRTQLFWIELLDVPTFVSVHFVRHKVGVEHYVRSNRDDRGGSNTVDRCTPVNHAMLCNAQALINMARKRLCNKAHADTVMVMKEIRKAVGRVDPDLMERMVPECWYRGRVCHEWRPCGIMPVEEKDLE